MGSTVIIAVKHGQIRKFEDQWVGCISSEMNFHDNLPKLFGQEVADTGYRYQRDVPLRAQGILVSAYKDNESEQNLYVNHDLMVGLPMLSLRTNGKPIDSELDIIKQLKKDVMRGNFPFGRFLKQNKLVPDYQDPYHTYEADSSISLFSIQTDSYSSETFSNHFKNMLLFVDTGLLSRETFGRMTINQDRHAIYSSGGDVEYLATLKPSTAAMINMCRGLTKIIKIPNRQLDFGQCMDSEINIKTDPIIPFVASLGIQFKPALKKSHEATTLGM